MENENLQAIYNSGEQRLDARRNKLSQRGQSLLEFALLLPFLTLLGMGVIEIGRAIFYTISVNNAAVAGVEYGSRDTITASDDAGMNKAAVCEANGGTGNLCNSGILTTANTTTAHGCTCDNNGGTTAESCTYPIPTGNCLTITCATGSQQIECVQVTTTATFTPIFHYPGLPKSYQANGKAVMRVRK
jgi:Flp pilus assembly protein TadG